MSNNCIKCNLGYMVEQVFNNCTKTFCSSALCEINYRHELPSQLDFDRYTIKSEVTK